jgi:hypothetical protein
MVELQASIYDGEENIPFANASIVTIDDELSDDPIVVPMAETMPVTSPSNHDNTQAVYETPPVVDISMQSRESSEGATSSLTGPSVVEEESSLPRNIPKAAATGGAVVGMLLGGPFLSLFLGVGSHHYSKQEGAMGDCARALGEVAIVAKEKFQQVDDRHHLLDKGKEAASRTWDRVQQADREHKLQEKMGYFVSHCYAVTLDFIYRHNLIERATEKFKKFVHCLMEAVHEHERRVHDRAHHSHHQTHHHHHHPHLHSHHHPQHGQCSRPPRHDAHCY